MSPADLGAWHRRNVAPVAGTAQGRMLCLGLLLAPKGEEGDNDGDNDEVDDQENADDGDDANDNENNGDEKKRRARWQW